MDGSNEVGKTHQRAMSMTSFAYMYPKDKFCYQLFEDIAELSWWH